MVFGVLNTSQDVGNRVTSFLSREAGLKQALDSIYLREGNCNTRTIGDDCCWANSGDLRQKTILAAILG